MKLKILLTGSRGFIGRNFLEKLGNYYNFISPSRLQLDLSREDFVRDFFVKHGPFDVVIHTANVGGLRENKDGPGVTKTNLEMFFNILKNDKHYEKLINLGSGAEYDKRHSIKNVREEQIGRSLPADPYGLSKYICSQTIEFLDNSVTLRIFGVFGKYEDNEVRFISNAICKSIFGLPITINKNVYFDYLYIDDLVRVVNHFINKKGKFKTYNVGSGKHIDLISLAQIVNDVAEKKVPVLIRNKGLANEYTCSTERLKKEIINLEFTKIEKAIADLYRWFSSNKHQLNKRAIFSQNQ